MSANDLAAQRLLEAIFRDPVERAAELFIIVDRDVAAGNESDATQEAADELIFIVPDLIRIITELREKRAPTKAEQ